MAVRAEEIASILKEQIENFDISATSANVFEKMGGRPIAEAAIWRGLAEDCAVTLVGTTNEIAASAAIAPKNDFLCTHLNPVTVLMFLLLIVGRTSNVLMLLLLIVGRTSHARPDPAG